MLDLLVPPNAVVKDACEQNAIIADVEGTRVAIKKDLVQVDSKKVIINGDVKVNGYIKATNDIVASDSVSVTDHTHMGVHGVTTPPIGDTDSLPD